MTPPPRLWSWKLSPFAAMVRIAFAEKDVPVELVEIDPARRPARLRELNVMNRVPTLELPDGTAIRDSRIICEWLEEVHPQPALWPADATARGVARGWADWIGTALVMNFFLAMRKQAFGKDPGDPEDVVDVLMGRMGRAWGTLEPVLAAQDGPWVCGEQFTYADACGVALAVRLPQWRADLVPDRAAMPHVDAWLEALRARPTAALVRAEGVPAEPA